MDPYAQPKEKKVGAKRPKISHLPSAVETRTRQERQAEKQAVAAERRAIKKSARRHLKKEMEEEISKIEIRNNNEARKRNEQNNDHSLFRTIAPKMFISSCAS